MKWLAVWALMLSLLSGCGGRALLPYAREMGDTALMRTVGLDAWEDGVLLSVSTGERAGGEEELALSASGPSVPAAALAVQSLGDSYVYYGHVDRMLIGEEQAVRGLEELMDYLAREPQLGLGVQLWVVYGGSAAQAMEQAGTGGVSRRLDQLNTDGELGAANMGCSAARLMSVLARRGSTCLPALALLPAREGDGGEGGELTLVPDGYAVLRQGRLVCRTDPETSRGIELMEGENGGDVVAMTLEDGTQVSLVTEDARTVCRPVFRDRELTGVTVDCSVNVRVAQTGRRLKERELDELAGRLERLLGERILRALELSQYWDADFLELERRVQLACPHKKRAIREQWTEAFRALHLRAEVHARIERSYGMMEKQE